MSKNKSDIETDNTQDQQLVRRLSETENTLKALIASQVDAVINPDFAAPVLLRNTQDALRQTNELLETIFSSIHNNIAYMDRDFNFIRVNRAYAETDGKDPSFFIGKNHFDLYPNEENEKIFRQVVETGIPYHTFNRPFVYAEHPERGVTYWDWTLQPIRGSAGEVNGVLLNLINVTDRVQAENALQASQIMFEHLFESAPDANILTDFNEKILAVNHQTEEQFGYQRTELIGESIDRLIPNHLADGMGIHRFHDTDPSQPSSPLEHPDIYGQQKNGERFPIDVNRTPIETANGIMVLHVIRDITYRKNVENALREQAQFIRLLQDIAVAANKADNIDAALQYALGRICQHTGWPVGHCLLLDESQGGLVSTKIWHLDNPKAYRRFCLDSEKQLFTPGLGTPGSVLETGTPLWISDATIIPTFQRKSSAIKAGLKGTFAFPILVGQTVVGVLEFFSHNIEERNENMLEGMSHIGTQLGRVIERQRNHESLAKQEKMLQTVLDTMPVGIWVTDEKGKIITANPAGNRIWNGARYVPPDQYGEYRAWWVNTGKLIKPNEWALSRALNKGEVSIDEQIEIEAFDGTHKIVSNSALPLRDINQRIIGAIAVNLDISDQKRLEAELTEVQRRLLDSVEKERTRMAQDLHDGPIQDLYGITFQIQSMQEINTSDENQVLLERTNDMVHQVIDSLRTTMSELKPPSLSHFGLSKAIRSHADTFQEKHPEINILLELEDDHNALPEHERMALFRNYQQLLTNILRHARAKNVWIRLKLDRQKTVLEVQDDGCGFSQPKRWIELARKGHLGLVGASERAEALGGHLEINSHPGKGALIRTVIPRKKS